MRTISRTIVPAILLAAAASAQPGILTKELLIKYTPEWKGERFADGRPRVPDGILKRMKTVTLEEAWAVVKQAGYGNQYEDGWFVIHPDKVLVGRALTAQWLPGRPDIHRVIAAAGQGGRPHRRAECVAGGYAPAAGRLRLRPLRPQGGRAVDRRQCRQRDLCEDRKRHRLRRRRARHQRTEGAG